MGRRRPYCQDWACPASASCRRHFGRSEAYWAMEEDAELFRGDRAVGEESCADYERDQIQPWMIEAYATPPLRDGGWRMPLFVAVGGW